MSTPSTPTPFVHPALEQLLLQLETAPDDRQLLDALFRCAHTIKGSAGVFGLDRVVTFTHHVEALLHRLREGHVELTPGLSTLLLQSNDVIRELVGQARDDEPDTPEALQVREGLVARLKQAGAGALTSAEPEAADRNARRVRAGRQHVGDDGLRDADVF